MNETQGIPVTLSQLGEVVARIKFKKLNYGILALPTVFLVISIVLFIYGISGLMETTQRIETSLTPEALYPLQWSIIMLLGYTFSSMYTSYILLRDIRDHLYESALATYYYTGGVSFESGYQYVKSMLIRYDLPSPVTGLILSFLTAGISYPIILGITEISIREHASIEEEALFKKTITKRYTWINLAVDIVILIATLGLYLIYMSHRASRVFNKHIERIHGLHPNPPMPPEQTWSPEETTLNNTTIVGILLIVLGYSIALSYLGIYPNIVVSIATGLSIYLAARMGPRNPVARLVFILGLIYLVAFTGLQAGLSSSTRFYPIVESTVKSLREAVETRPDPLWPTLFIFTNNFAVSSASIIPYIGSIILMNGVFNSGFIMGVLSGIGRVGYVDALLLFTFPHSVLELSAYATLVVSSTYISEWRRFIVFTTTGFVLLLLAAITETHLILSR